MKQRKNLIAEALPQMILMSEEPMSRHTTFRIGGPAELFAVPGSEELPILLKLAEREQIPVTVIGNGSNLLVGDGGIRGLVIEVGSGMDEIRVTGDRLVAGAGALLSKAAQTAVAAGLGGMEFAAGIPGNLGGAVVMNAGAYGGEMKDILERVTVLDVRGQEHVLELEDLELGYRHSCIPEKKYIVTEAVLKLAVKPKEEIRSRMAELREQRVSKQPLEFPSAGSTFKRPEGYFAGKLIMDAGLSGYRVGDAQVSEKHCGFVINRGKASAAEVCQLMQDVQNKVEESFGVKLEPEVKMIGDFSDGSRRQ